MSGATVMLSVVGLSDSDDERLPIAKQYRRGLAPCASPRIFQRKLPWIGSNVSADVPALSEPVPPPMRRSLSLASKLAVRPIHTRDMLQTKAKHFAAGS
jgi:hypothetical protein